ncbi:MAG: diadenosine tetraphosphatase [Betaproteobacteria bacterium SG8_39]|nr:MAG: diadenosine tetraphosphatase [Betaproteobacteria bacterium SG8_39]
MATYAIGDVQGCFDELQALLARLDFDSRHDRLWFVGDLVNRGPQSLEVLRFVRDLGERAVTVLGNHDFHLLCVFEGHEKPRTGDTLDRVLDAPDARELVDWLRSRPLMHVERNYAMVHAGLLPQWTISMARALAEEVQRALAAPNYGEFLAHLYGGAPDHWDEALTGWDRLRVLVNAMTRMRFCTLEGRMNVRAKGREAPAGYLPWFEARPTRAEAAIVCGHWSTLGLKLTERLAVLDTGCVWGGALSALRLEDRALTQLPCARHRVPGED